jgi:hypothetical protein
MNNIYFEPHEIVLESVIVKQMVGDVNQMIKDWINVSE